jgi:hypothetical protein
MQASEISKVEMETNMLWTCLEQLLQEVVVTVAGKMRQTTFPSQWVDKRCASPNPQVFPRVNRSLRGRVYPALLWVGRRCPRARFYLGHFSRKLLQKTGFPGPSFSWT